MPSWGMADKPDANQGQIVKDLRALGWLVLIAKRPVDLWVVSPDEEYAFWVEVKTGAAESLTDLEQKFFDQFPERFRIVAYTAQDVINHRDKLWREKSECPVM